MTRDGSRRDLAWLAMILGVALAVRLWYLFHVTATPGFVWDDPDGYVEHGLALVSGGTWHWTYDAVEYSIAGRTHALPPLYSVFLSLFAGFPHFPLTARLAQVVLAVVAVGLVFVLGRTTHSPRAGLLAAGAYAIWVPNILNVWSASQEALYLPLVMCAFVVLTRAIAVDGGAARFFAAGLVFGFAALTRSMPMLFIAPAGLAHVAISRTRGRAALQAAAMLAGFAAVTVPYSVDLSRHFGQVTFIDSHGSIHGASKGDASTGRPPGIVESLAGLMRVIASEPLAYLTSTAERARTLFYVNGGRLLQIYVVAGGRLSALAWKALIHLGSDVPLLLSVALAGIGVAVSTSPRATIANGVAEFTLTSDARPIQVVVRVAGVEVQRLVIAPGEARRVRCLAPAPGLAFIELQGTESGHSTPAEYRITIGG